MAEDPSLPSDRPVRTSPSLSISGEWLTGSSSGSSVASDVSSVVSDDGEETEAEAEVVEVAVTVQSLLFPISQAFCTCGVSPSSRDHREPATLEEIASGYRERLHHALTPEERAEYRSTLDAPGLMDATHVKRNFSAENWLHLVSQEGAAPLGLTESQYPTPIPIHRHFDVDSVIARVTSLAVFREGFELAYTPSFYLAINQDPHFTIEGHRIDSLKQLRFGRGHASGYDCYVFFPQLPKASYATNHLNHDDQSTWIDDIVLPSLREVCPPDVLVHHPASFGLALGHARAPAEASGQGPRRPIDVRATVREAHLEALWAAIYRRCQATTRFRDPFLVIQAHDLKLRFKRATLTEARAAFEDHLDRLFRPQYFDDHFWVDVAFEDTPALSPGDPGITLLRKRPCLDRCATFFHEPSGRAKRVQVSILPWASTRDAGRASFDPDDRGTWKARHGLGFTKSYNLHKVLFATPLKGYEPFGDAKIGNLALSQAELDFVGQQNASRGALQTRIDRAESIKRLYQAKARLAATLARTKNLSYGARLEVRMKLSTFRALEGHELDPFHGEYTGTSSFLREAVSPSARR